MEILKRWRAYCEDKRNKSLADNIRYDFKIKERDGKLYYVYGSVAFATVPMEATASEIAAKLNEAREAALKFERL